MSVYDQGRVYNLFRFVQLEHLFDRERTDEAVWKRNRRDDPVGEGSGLEGRFGFYLEFIGPDGGDRADEES